jgi:hypothetical protein
MISKKKKIILLGMMSRMPVAGNIWLVVQYLVGFRRLGYDVYYVESHGLNPSMFVEYVGDDGAVKAASFIARIMKRFDLSDHWAFHALHDNSQCYGMSGTQLNEIYRAADLIINLHGGTIPLSLHRECRQLVYLETDPVAVELKCHNGDQNAIDLLSAHSSFFTWGLNYGNPDCQVPIPEGIKFIPLPPPVILDFWENQNEAPGNAFTTIANWRQKYKKIRFNGEVYHWSKHHEFKHFLDLPSRTESMFELALGSYDKEDQDMLERKGWRVRDALSFSQDLDQYRRYIVKSYGEFTVAKDQNIRLRSGWFSERSAQYLAAGRPVITQETGFSNALPTGHGLFAFTTTEEIETAIECIKTNYQQHCRAARSLAREYFSYDVVLPRLLANLDF